MDLVWSVESCGLSVLSLVDIVNCPFLAQLICELTDTNILAFFVLVVDDLNDSAITNILEVVLGELELLEPTSIG